MKKGRKWRWRKYSRNGTWEQDDDCFKTRILKGKKIGKEGGENTKTGREKKEVRKKRKLEMENNIENRNEINDK